MSRNDFTLVGRRIVEVRAMTQRELDVERWYADGFMPVLVLDDGTAIFPSRDGEGNGPGVLLGKSAKAQRFRVVAPQRA